MGKFQMIKPYPSDKIYESSNVNKCAKKFYEILKQDNEKYDFFILKNMDNNNYYKFRIGNNHNIQIGGEIKPEQKPEIKPEQNYDIVKRIEKIESRVTILETKRKKEDNDSDKSDGGNLDIKNKIKRGLITPPEKDGNMCSVM